MRQLTKSTLRSEGSDIHLIAPKSPIRRLISKCSMASFAFAVLVSASGCSWIGSSLAKNLTTSSNRLVAGFGDQTTERTETTGKRPNKYSMTLAERFAFLRASDCPPEPQLAEERILTSAVATPRKRPSSRHSDSIQLTSSRQSDLRVIPAAHSTSDEPDVSGGVITIDGRTYEIRLVSKVDTGQSRLPVYPTSLASIESTTDAEKRQLEAVPVSEEEDPAADDVLLNLPTALSMVGGDHPAVAFAQWRVQEAYAQLDGARSLWLPSLQAGFSLHRHDGNYQASNGQIVDVNRSSFQYGLGAGATGAGTNPRHGLQAQFHLADAIFQPQIAQTTAWARGHAANAAVNQQMLEVALAYVELLDRTQDLRIIEDSRERTAQIAKLTDDFAAAGQGLQADADRMQTELTLIEGRIAVAREAVDLASASLAHALSARADQRIIPMDTTVVPIQLVSTEVDKSSLIQTGLANRPELKESQALVAAACEQYRRQRYAPFVPSVLLGMSTGAFGGGNGTTIANVDGRFDFDALVTWEIRNLGFGERAARKESAARVQQARFRKIRLLDDVARQVSEAHTQVVHREERMAITELAITTAENSFQRNLSRIRDGQGLPLEVLQSVRALEDARRAYADAVVAYNESQFRLQWALGWQVTAGQAMSAADKE